MTNLTSEQIERLRPGFEAYYPKAHPKAVDPLHRDHTRRYSKLQVEAAWQGWKAALAYAQAPAAIERAALQLFAEQGRSRYCLEEVAKAIKAAVEN
jgi:hypothetical protein